jgi:hypothetical protein
MVVAVHLLPHGAYHTLHPLCIATYAEGVDVAVNNLAFVCIGFIGESLARQLQLAS